MYWLQLMDKYAANWSVLLIAITECILVAWIYGADRFLDDIQQMIGVRSRLWRLFWTWMWKFITPAALFFILFFNWVEYEPLRYGTYVYPIWADAVGWTVGMLPVVVIIGLAIVSTFQSQKSTQQNNKTLHFYLSFAEPDMLKASKIQTRRRRRRRRRQRELPKYHSVADEHESRRKEEARSELDGLRSIAATADRQLGSLEPQSLDPLKDPRSHSISR